MTAATATKDTIWWAVKREHLNHPIRRRLVDYSLAKQGAEIAPDARGRLTEFLDYLAKNDLVVAYDPDYEQYGLAEPFYFVPRDPNLDAHGEIVRRHRVETETRQNAVQYDRGRRESDGYAEGARDGAAEQRDLDRDIVENRIMPIIESLEALNSALRDAVALIGRQAR